MSTCIDLFSGCGGLSLGLGKAGFTTLFGVEAHPHAFATYEHNLLDRAAESHSWPSWLERRAWKAEDLLDRHGDDLARLRGKVDLVAGGPPCQGFSTNGKRKADDPRSRMVEVYLKYVEIMRPQMVLMENVIGITSMPHRDGGTYSEFVARELDALGYDVWFDIIRAADWGVPQRRPRFVLIAIRKSGQATDPIALLRGNRGRFLAERTLSAPLGTAAALSDLVDLGTPDDERGHVGSRKLVRAELPATPYQRLMRAGCEGQPGDMRLPQHGEKATKRMKEILDTCTRGIRVGPADRERMGIKKRVTTPLDPAAPAPTLSTLPDDFIHYEQPRAMSVREHARLQSFPDLFEFRGPYTAGGKARKDSCPRYTQVGNAVPPLLAEAIGETLQQVLAGSRHMET